METSLFKKVCAFIAHFTAFAFWSYLVGWGAGFCGYTGTSAIILTFVTGWLLSVAVSTLLFSFFAATPLEWVWGCKLKIDRQQKNKFVSYLLWRLAMKWIEFDDCKVSWRRYLLGGFILVVVIAVYFV